MSTFDNQLADGISNEFGINPSTGNPYTLDELRNPSLILTPELQQTQSAQCCQVNVNVTPATAPGSGAVCVANVLSGLATINSGEIVEIQMVTGGQGYVNPQIVISDPYQLSQAYAVATIGSIGLVQGVITEIAFPLLPAGISPGDPYTYPVSVTNLDGTIVNSYMQYLDLGKKYTTPIFPLSSVVINDSNPLATGAKIQATTQNISVPVTGQILNVHITPSGSGYIQASTTVTVSDQGGQGTGAILTATVGTIYPYVPGGIGAINSVSITGGMGFPSNSAAMASVHATIVDQGGTGTGATITPIFTNLPVNTTYSIKATQLWTPTGLPDHANGGGSGYGPPGTYLNIATISDPTGSGAVLETTTGNYGVGQYQAISMIRCISVGSGYTNPELRINGTGTGCTASIPDWSTFLINAQPVPNYVLTGFTINTQGVGYTNPKINVTGLGSATVTAAITLVPVRIPVQGVTAINVVNGGMNYTNPTFTINGAGTGAPITGTFDIGNGTISVQGAITQLKIIDGGYNYTNPTITISDPTGTGFDTTGLTITTGPGYVSSPTLNAISSITVTNHGSGYTLPSITIIDEPDGSGPGQGATATALTGIITVPVANIVHSIDIIDGGSNYLPNSTYISISDPAGQGAQGIPTIKNGVITAINVTNSGSNYINPKIVITDITGNGAKAEAIVNHNSTLMKQLIGQSGNQGAITSINILNGGSGYSNPTIHIVEGTNTSATATATVNNGVITNIDVINGGLEYTVYRYSLTDQAFELLNPNLTPVGNFTPPYTSVTTFYSSAQGASPTYVKTGSLNNNLKDYKHDIFSNKGTLTKPKFFKTKNHTISRFSFPMDYDFFESNFKPSSLIIKGSKHVNEINYYFHEKFVPIEKLNIKSSFIQKSYPIRWSQYGIKKNKGTYYNKTPRIFLISNYLSKSIVMNNKGILNKRGNRFINPYSTSKNNIAKNGLVTQNNIFYYDDYGYDTFVYIDAKNHKKVAKITSKTGNNIYNFNDYEHTLFTKYFGIQKNKNRYISKNIMLHQLFYDTQGNRFTNPFSFAGGNKNIKGHHTVYQGLNNITSQQYYIVAPDVFHPLSLKINTKTFMQSAINLFYTEVVTYIKTPPFVKKESMKIKTVLDSKNYTMGFFNNDIVFGYVPRPIKQQQFKNGISIQGMSFNNYIKEFDHDIITAFNKTYGLVNKYNFSYGNVSNMTPISIGIEYNYFSVPVNKTPYVQPLIFGRQYAIPTIGKQPDYGRMYNYTYIIR